jgi:glucosylceramidase
MLKYISKYILFFIGILPLSFNALSLHAQIWTSTADTTVQLVKYPLTKIENTATIPSGIIKVKVNSQKTYQTMEGFGYALTGGSAQVIHHLSKEKRKALINEIFGSSSSSLGVSYIRISMGSSDLDAEVFSYCDLPKNEVDPQLTHFNLSKDTVHLIPILKEILAIQPNIKIMASPWSAPIWMKSNGISMGGHLLKKYYASYALYFEKYIKAMQSKGIQIHSLTMQNEPEHGGNNPSMLMSAEEQTEFLRDYLGPQLKAAKLKTEIVLFDHNADHPNYPITILNDAKARSYASATAFHLYLGKEEALSEVHKAYPDKKIYFTEQWTGAKGSYDEDFMWHLAHIVIGTIENWSAVVLEWNLANDAKFEPHTPFGCTECKGAFTIQDSNIQRNVSYYIIGQIAKFVKPGAIRTLSSSTDASLLTTSFNLKNGKKVIKIII